MEEYIRHKLFSENIEPDEHYRRRKELDSVRVKITRLPQQSPEVLKISDVTVATSGNVSVSLGKAKSRKTFNVTAMVAALLSGKKVLQYTGQLPKGKQNILYIDTEQSYTHCYRVIDRILTMAGLPKNVEPDHLYVVRLREIGTFSRRDYIRWALEELPGIGFVVIDGLRDLVKDINSSTEAQEVLDLLQEWSGALDIHIHVVLHLNKIDDNARGHVGTEIMNKAETIILVAKSNNKDVSVVKPLETRDREFPSFSFHINGKGIPELHVSETADKNKRLTLEDITWEQHKVVLDKTFKGHKYSNQRSLIQGLAPLYGDIGFNRGETTLKTLVTMLVNRNVLEVTEKGEYRYHPDVIGEINGA